VIVLASGVCRPTVASTYNIGLAFFIGGAIEATYATDVVE
jgi:hypothetical protein